MKLTLTQETALTDFARRLSAQGVELTRVARPDVERAGGLPLELRAVPEAEVLEALQHRALTLVGAGLPRSVALGGKPGVADGGPIAALAQASALPHTPVAQVVPPAGRYDFSHEELYRYAAQQEEAFARQAVAIREMRTAHERAVRALDAGIHDTLDIMLDDLVPSLEPAVLSRVMPLTGFDASRVGGEQVSVVLARQVAAVQSALNSVEANPLHVERAAFNFGGRRDVERQDLEIQRNRASRELGVAQAALAAVDQRAGHVQSELRALARQIEDMDGLLRRKGQQVVQVDAVLAPLREAGWKTPEYAHLKLSPTWFRDRARARALKQEFSVRGFSDLVVARHGLDAEVEQLQVNLFAAHHRREGLDAALLQLQSERGAMTADVARHAATDAQLGQALERLAGLKRDCRALEAEHARLTERLRVLPEQLRAEIRGRLERHLTQMPADVIARTIKADRTLSSVFAQMLALTTRRQKCHEVAPGKLPELEANHAKSLAHMRKQVREMRDRISELDRKNRRARSQGRATKPYPKLKPDALKWSLGHWEWNKREKMMKELKRSYAAPVPTRSAFGSSSTSRTTHDDWLSNPLHMFSPWGLFAPSAGSDGDRLDRDDGANDRGAEGVGASGERDDAARDAAAADGAFDGDSRVHS